MAEERHHDVMKKAVQIAASVPQPLQSVAFSRAVDLLIDDEAKRACGGTGDALWEEYELLQDKIDKIGAFRFQVKGWLITLTTTFIFAGLAAGLPRPTFCLAIPFVAGFFVIEKQQRAWERGFISRIVAIERAMRVAPVSRWRKHAERVKRGKRTVILPTSPLHAISMIRQELERNRSTYLI